MEVLIHLRLRVYLVGLFALVSTIAAGCRETEQIHSHAALAAMVNAGDQIWFIKLKGERSVVAAQGRRIQELFEVGAVRCRRWSK